LPEEKVALAQWLVDDRWDNYTNPEIAYEYALTWIDRGGFQGEDRRTYWITIDDHTRVGLIQLYDLLDPTAMFDIRINTIYRGRGIGRQAVKWLTDLAFSRFGTIARLEAHTRQDNLAMRKILLVCGFVKEAHYRGGWQAGAGPIESVDTVGYAILRYDWMHHTTTPVDWDDLRPV